MTDATERVAESMCDAESHPGTYARHKECGRWVNVEQWQRRARAALAAMTTWRSVESDPPPTGVDLFLARRPVKAAGELFEKIGTGQYDASGLCWDWPWKTPPEFWALPSPLPPAPTGDA